MPNIVSFDVSIHDAPTRRTIFKDVRIRQVFYCNDQWWYKRTWRTAVPADRAGSEAQIFRFKQSVIVFDEAVEKPKKRGLSYDDFVNQSSL